MSESFRLHPEVFFPDAAPVGYGFDTEAKSLPGKLSRTEYGTRWSGSRPGRWKNPGMSRPRSTRHCCCTPLRGSGTCREKDWYRTLAVLWPLSAIPRHGPPTRNENGPFALRPGSAPCSRSQRRGSMQVDEAYRQIRNPYGRQSPFLCEPAAEGGSCKFVWDQLLVQKTC